MRALAIQGESLSAADDSIESFKMKLAEIIEEGDLTLNQVFNCESVMKQVFIGSFYLIKHWLVPEKKKQRGSRSLKNV